MSRVPEMRFEGFTEPWEQRKLGDMLTERNIQHPQSEEFPLVSFTVENGVTPKTERYEREQLVRGDKSNKKYKETRLNDIVYNPANLKFGAIARNKLGNAVFSPIYVTFDVNENASSTFVEKLVTRSEFIQRALQYQQGTVYERMSVSSEDLCDLDIRIPSLAEQNKIGSFLDLIDKTITLHQRKYDRLKNLKKAYLQKMFPKEGESVPEMRFEGFTEPWEQRKLSDFLTLSKIPGHTGVDAKKLTVKLWGKGVVEKTDKIGGSENTQYYIRRAGQLMYGKLDFLHAAFGIVPESLDNYESTLDSPAFDLHDIDGKFLVERVTQESFYLKNGMIANGSRKAKRIHEDTFLAMDIMVPTYQEQKQIGAFFDELDKTITLHQRKLDRLKHLKQAYLQKMFV